jgi:hypothetical protein
VNPNDLLESDGGPLIADNSEINVLFIHSAVDDMDLTPHAFRVLCHLKRRTNHSGRAFPGMRSIAKKCAMSVGMVHRSIVDLQKRGMLAVQHRGENVSNAYVLTSPKCWKNPDGTPFQHPSLGCSHSEQGCSPNEQGVHGVNGGVHIVNSAVHQVNERISKEGDPPKEIQKKVIQEETTTTTRTCACAKAPEMAEAPSSSFSSVAAVEEEPTGKLSPEDRLELDQIANDLGSDGRQKAKAVAIAKRRGTAFVRDQADIVRNDPKIRNLAAAFEKACDSPEGWKRPKAAAKKPARRKPADPKPEEAPSEPQADFSAELAWWQSVTDAQREDILRDPRFDLYRKSMRKGVTAASLGLPVLREVLAELAQKAGSAAAEMAKAQQPEQQAA